MKAKIKCIGYTEFSRQRVGDREIDLVLAVDGGIDASEVSILHNAIDLFCRCCWEDEITVGRGFAGASDEKRDIDKGSSES